MVYFLQFGSPPPKKKNSGWGKQILSSPWHWFITDKSKEAKYILSYKHEYGFIADTMEILHMTQKGVTVDVYERFHMYKCRKYDQILN
jgi:hypothetical protein